MKFFTLALVATMLSSSLVFSQEFELGSKPKYVNVNFAPLSLFARTPRIRLGIELFGVENFVFGFDAGYGYPLMVAGTSSDYSSWADDYKSVEFRPEVKYIIRESMHNRQYVAFEGFYMRSTDQFYDSYYFPADESSDVHYNRADFELEKFGWHFKYGVIHKLSEKMTMEYYAGIGLAHRKKAYSNVVAAAANPAFEEDDNYFFGSFKNEVNRKTLHFALGLKFGFDFSRK